MDASVLLLPELGLIDAHDPRFASTVAAIEQDLVRGRHVMRYAAEDDFGLPETEFLVCRFWLIDALAALGRREEARERYQDALALRNSYGLLAEDIHPQTGALWGNFPQTYSMAGVILSAMRLSQSWEDRYWRGTERLNCPSKPASSTAQAQAQFYRRMARDQRIASLRHQPEAVDEGKADHPATSASFAPSTDR